MRQRTLGRTGLKVSALTIGGLYTSSLAGGVSETERIMRRAIELGINAIDTAPAYADSEATVGQAMRGLQAPLVLMTKVGGRPQPFNPQDIHGLRTSVEECLRFALSNDFVSTVPIGCKSMEQLEARVAAVEKGPLPADILERLDQIANLVPRRPFEEPMILPFGKRYNVPGIANMGAAVQVGKT